MPLSLLLLLVLRPLAAMPWTILADVPFAHGGLVSKRELSLPAKAVTAYYEGCRLATEGNLTKAAEKLQSAIRAYPGYWEAYSALGSVYVALGKNADALKMFEQAAALEPASAVVQTNLAVGYLISDQFDEAAKAARSAVSLDPLYARGQFIYGWILAVTGQPEAAIRHLEAAGKMPTAQKLLEHIRRNISAK